MPVGQKTALLTGFTFAEAVNVFDFLAFVMSQIY